ncbi:hypothetical protein SLEP1_g41262 [Rubroshorea leprosula]|uniref:Uncharacterized protein n=1 Tax=Rubroshorea leprosula TaxID=152421 RepID=A0AAV5L6I7_9ROSI|nr:hypothetical protein SLEP1_g41262 [Rubroshorea leprosula]
MSSDEARSVVGSEVVPLEYGGMDSETSPSPTSSERTVGDRMEQTVIEEEEDEIPSNILEARNGVDGCYDPDLEVVAEVRGYVSELGSRDSLRALVGNCNLPHNVLLRPAGVNERACLAPHDHWMPIYLHYLIAGLRGERGWYHFSPRSSSKGNKNLFSLGPSSIKGWKENFFFVDDTEWSRRDAEVEQLFAWKAKKTKQNNYKLNEDEVEEVEKLVREDGDVVDILHLTTKEEVKDFNCGGEGGDMGGRLSSVSAPAVEVQPRPEPAMGGSEEVSEEMAPLQRKKRRVAELGTEVVEFVSQPSPEINPEDGGRGEVEVRGFDGGRERTPPHIYQKSLFEAENKTGAKHFLNATLPEVDRMRAKDEVVSHAGYTIVRHALECLTSDCIVECELDKRSSARVCRER